MKKIINILIFIIVIFTLGYSIEEKTELLGIDISYDGEKYEIDDIYFEYGFPSKPVEVHTHSISINDLGNNQIYSLNIMIGSDMMPPPPYWFDENGNQIDFEDIPINELVTIFTPYVEEMDMFQLLDLNNNILIQENIHQKIGIEYNSENNSYMIIFIIIICIGILFLIYEIYKLKKKTN
jgi:hypothetical protein